MEDKKNNSHSIHMDGNTSDLDRIPLEVKDTYIDANGEKKSRVILIEFYVNKFASLLLLEGLKNVRHLTLKSLRDSAQPLTEKH